MVDHAAGHEKAEISPAKYRSCAPTVTEPREVIDGIPVPDKDGIAGIPFSKRAGIAGILCLSPHSISPSPNVVGGHKVVDNIADL